MSGRYDTERIEARGCKAFDPYNTHLDGPAMAMAAGFTPIEFTRAVADRILVRCSSCFPGLNRLMPVYDRVGQGYGQECY